MQLSLKFLWEYLRRCCRGNQCQSFHSLTCIKLLWQPCLIAKVSFSRRNLPLHFTVFKIDFLESNYAHFSHRSDQLISFSVRVEISLYGMSVSPQLTIHMHTLSPLFLCIFSAPGICLNDRWFFEQLLTIRSMRT